MFSKKVRLNRELFEKIRTYAELAGYSSVDEFVVHALEKEIARFEGADSEEEIRKRLKGLGYLA